MSTLPFSLETDVSLAPLTTLGLGGQARQLTIAYDEATVVAAVSWARARGMDLLVLGGGSNVVVADAGFDGLVLRMANRGQRWEDGDRGRMLVHAAAGEPWDALVDAAAARGCAGIECLAGIPGLVGATPIQNVGAYGQDVSQTIVGVRVFERATQSIVELPASACGFAYRDSAFKRRPDAHVVLGVTFALTPHGVPVVRYRELENHLQTAPSTAGGTATLAEVSAAVRLLRRKKSMVLDAQDPNHRSVGSFFTNPVVPRATVAAVVARAIASQLARAPADVPQFPADGGAGGGVGGDGGDPIKLSAAWLIEHAGFARGFRRGAVGLSSNHALALVHHGGGTTAELLTLARDIRDAVQSIWGVTLVPEPTLVGEASL